ADAPDLLAALINAVRSSDPPVRVVEVLNPHIDPTEFLGKYIVLDILAEDEQGRRYNIEMQVRRHKACSERSIYYLACTFTQPLQAGGDYETLKPAIGIHLLDFDLFPDSTQAHWCFEMRDRHQPSVTLGEELQLNLAELPKACGSAPCARWMFVPRRYRGHGPLLPGGTHGRDRLPACTASPEAHPPAERRRIGPAPGDDA
ncbi:MAG: Rpn family recombination-promoting nuclease/putative transposase, partial [Gammaproteobacteria bacterium]